MSPGGARKTSIPEAVVRVLDEFSAAFSVEPRLWAVANKGGHTRLYPLGLVPGAPAPDACRIEVPTRTGAGLVLEIPGPAGRPARAAGSVVRHAIGRLWDYSEAVRYYSDEISERHEEINLLYSVSETLGSFLSLEEAARLILTEVCEVMAARRGSLWVLDEPESCLHLVASVGAEGRETPITTDDPHAVTARVLREGTPVILADGRGDDDAHAPRSDELPRGTEPVLSVPIRFTPSAGGPRPVGVLNLIGRRHGGRFKSSDRKLLSAIASQVGAALENNRLVRERLERERVTRELELAHDLQMQLLPDSATFAPGRVAARVESAASVAGDLYQFFRMPGERLGVMIGDVSTHGFPAALIMARTMSAATIYAAEVHAPARVFQEVGRALIDDLESTEMYLTLFYALVDPDRRELLYANAGHPHAFLVRDDGETERLGALDPPMGMAGVRGYQQRAVPWNAGTDLLLLFTDGLSDNLVPGSRVAGERHVVKEAARLRARPVSEIVDALFTLGGQGATAADDRTALVLRI